MNAIALLRHQLEMSKNLTASLLADMQDAPLTAPTPNGGNHPLWVAGHLAYAEARLTSEALLGTENPLADWKEMFKGGSQPQYDATGFPTIPEILAKWDEVRANTLKILDSLSDEDLDKPAANPPAGREEAFGTYGKIYSILVMHSLMHRGQVADSRRAAGRDVLMA